MAPVKPYRALAVNFKAFCRESRMARVPALPSDQALASHFQMLSDTIRAKVTGRRTNAVRQCPSQKPEVAMRQAAVAWLNKMCSSGAQIAQCCNGQVRDFGQPWDIARLLLK